MFRPDQRRSQAWILSAAICVLLAPGCVSRERYERAVNTIGTQDEVISSYQGRLPALETRNEELERKLRQQEAELQRARSSATALRDANQSLSEKYAELRDSMSQDALPAGVSLANRADGVAFQVEGSILFDSGKTEIKESGKGTLSDIIARIRGGSERIRVEGHTDNVPVTKTKHLYPLGNLQLSGERALRVADFMRSQGIPSDRIYYAGMGEHDPRSSNATADGQAQNRRVEIVLVFAEPRD